MNDALKELFPPGVPPLVRWRLVVFLAFAGFLLFITWALSPYGFAMAGELGTLRGNVDNVRLTLIEQSLYDAKESECASTNAQARRFFASRVLALSREYHQLSRLEADIPPCRGVVSD